MAYRYETHLHTWPASKCARVDIIDCIDFYASLGYDGIFVTNHFLDGNIGCDKSLPYEEQISFYEKDYLTGLEYAKECGIKLFFGVEMSYGGTDFLIYGLDADWYRAHPEIMNMKKSEELTFLAGEGALIIQAHPFREASYIDHIRLFPRYVHGVEVINGCRTDFENDMAKHYADSYSLVDFAGTDNHIGGRKARLCGMEFESPITSEADFVEKVKAELGVPFIIDVEDK